MNEQTILNAEQEAFLAYQAASTKRLESSNKINEAFNRYVAASNAAKEAYESYLELNKANDAEFVRCNELYNEWVKVRKY